MELTPGYDVWSAACLLFEAATGSKLFDLRQGRDYSLSEHHLWMMEGLLGRPPKQVKPVGRACNAFICQDTLTSVRANLQ